MREEEMIVQCNQSEPNHGLVRSGDVVFEPSLAERLPDYVEVLLKWT